MTWVGASWLILRRSTIVLPVALITVTGVLLGLGESSPGFYDWRDRTAAVAAGLTLVLPVLAGVSAFLALRLRRSAAFELIRTAKDGGVRATLTLAASLSFLALGAFTVLAVGLFLPWGSSGLPPGGPEWSWLVSSFCALLGAQLTGFLLGTLLPWWWSSAAAGIVSYSAGVVVLVLGGAVSPTAPLLSPLFVASLGPFFALNDALFTARSVWFGGVSVLVVALSLLAVSRSKRAASLIAVVGLLLGAVGCKGVVASQTGVTLDAGSAPLHCAGSEPVLCLLPVFEQHRATLRAAVDPVHRRLADTPFEFTRVELTQRGAGGEATRGSVALHVDDFGAGWRPRDLGEFVQDLLDSREPGAVCKRLGPREPLGYVEGPALVFLAWATGLRQIADAWEGGGDAFDRLTSLTGKQQKEWVTAGAADFCRGTAPVSTLQ